MHNVRLDTSLESLLDRVLRDSSPAVLATIVATAGSTYRKPGARMLIMADGSYIGLLSGGCLEADLGEHARNVLESGTPQAIEYDMRGPDDILFGIGAGCEGAMRILLEPAGAGSLAADTLRSVGHTTALGAAASIVAVHESAAWPLGSYTATAPLSAPLLQSAQQASRDAASRSVDIEENGHRTRAFVQYVAPAPHLLICGAAPDAQPVARAASALGWRVTVIDHRESYADARLFPGVRVVRARPSELRSVLTIDEFHAAVVMSHHLPSDVSYLRELAAAGVPGYIGLLGPSARRHRIEQELGADAQRLASRIRGPVGIDIGAVTPEGIALAIISEIHAWLAGRAQHSKT